MCGSGRRRGRGDTDGYLQQIQWSSQNLYSKNQNLPPDWVHSFWCEASKRRPAAPQLWFVVCTTSWKTRWSCLRPSPACTSTLRAYRPSTPTTTATRRTRSTTSALAIQYKELNCDDWPEINVVLGPYLPSEFKLSKDTLNVQDQVNLGNISRDISRDNQLLLWGLVAANSNSGNHWKESHASSLDLRAASMI